MYIFLVLLFDQFAFACTNCCQNFQEKEKHKLRVSANANAFHFICGIVFINVLLFIFRSFATMFRFKLSHDTNILNCIQRFNFSRWIWNRMSHIVLSSSSSTNGSNSSKTSSSSMSHKKIYMNAYCTHVHISLLKMLTIESDYWKIDDSFARQPWWYIFRSRILN